MRLHFDTLREKNFKSLYIIVIITVMILCSACGNTDVGAQATTNNKQTNNTTTPATTQSPKKSFSINGAYTCSVQPNSISIKYAKAANDDATTTYADYEWAASRPSDYQEMKYGDPVISFYDEQHGAMLAYLGAGAGSAYYSLYYTADAGKTWVKFNSNVQKTNTNASLFFIDANTLMLLDHGIGISTPNISAYTCLSDSITCKVNHRAIAELPDMLKSLSITKLSGNTLSCEYEIMDTAKQTTQKATIDLSTYIK
jgi:photosystem II stability/assembly factor-like uncharacterized protein